MTLSDLEAGQRAVIAAVDAADTDVQRLMVLGLVEGSEVQFVAAAIGGDPLEFKLYGSAVSLRREQARHFVVEPLP